MVLFNHIAGGDKSFPKGISPKVNVIARLELTYYDNTVKHIIHYATSSPPLPQLWAK